MVPMVIFSTALVVYLVDQRAQILENQISTTTKALVTAVDQNLASVTSSLSILSTSESFDASSIQFLHKRLRKFVKERPDWDHISLVDTTGRQIFHTSFRYGKRLKNLRDEDYFRKMLRTKSPVVAGFQEGHDFITVAVPVKQDGTVIFALIGAVKFAAFDRFLSGQKFPRNWTAAILDDRLLYLAHSGKSSQFRGKRASSNFSHQVQLEDNHRFFYTTTRGDDIFMAMANSTISDWKIILRIPDDGLLFTSWQTIVFFIAVGLILLVLSVVSAFLLARRISRPLFSLTRSAKALGEGSAVPDIATNISEITIVNEALKSAAQSRDESEQKIKEAVNIRDTFLSVASHELKTPMTSMKLQLQMLQRKLPGEFDLSLKKILDQVIRLNVLVDDLLDVTRISAGKMTYEPETFDLSALISECVGSLSGKELIELELPKSFVGYWDRHRLEQVVLNLASNAIKYGNGQPVRISLRKEADVAVLEVRDHGLGIAEADIHKIFERYERVGDHSRSIKGLGLGLWIVQKILEGMGGSISVTSSLGNGSTFVVTIPFESFLSQGLTSRSSPDLSLH